MVAFLLKCKNICHMPGDLDHVIFLTLCTQHIAYNRDECRIYRKAEFDVIFLKLRLKLKNVNKTAGWGPVQAYNIQLVDLILVTDFIFGFDTCTSSPLLAKR